MGYFTSTFTQEYNSVKTQLDSLQTGQTTSGSTNEDHPKDPDSLLVQLQDTASKVELLQKYLNESTSFLPSRTITQFMGQISTLHAQIGQLKQSSAPKKKFAFKSKKTAPISSQAAKETSSEVTAKTNTVKTDEESTRKDQITEKITSK